MRWGNSLFSSFPQLTVQPSTSMLYEPVIISGVGLPKSSQILLKSSLKCRNNRFDFESINKYRISETGKFSTATSETLQGSSYSGVHAAGPLWSMRPKKGSRKRLWMSDMKVPLSYSFRIYDNHHTLLDEQSMTKLLMPPTTKRIGISKGNIQGALFMPEENKKETQTKAVITIFGGAIAGRAPEDMAALFSSKGFVSLALAFYGAKGQPQLYSHIDLEKLEEAVDFLRNLPEVEDKRIGLYGLSKGGDICAGMAAFLGEKIGGTVVVNNPFASMPGKMTYKKEIVESSEFVHDWEKMDIFQIKGGVGSLVREPKRQIPIERAFGPILSIAGLDDSFNRFGELQDIAEARANRAGKKNFQALKYEGLGHLLDPPNSPVCLEGPNPLVDRIIPYGGNNIQQHSLAQIAAWDRVVQFLETY